LELSDDEKTMTGKFYSANDGPIKDQFAIVTFVRSFLRVVGDEDQ